MTPKVGHLFISSPGLHLLHQTWPRCSIRGILNKDRSPKVITESLVTQSQQARSNHNRQRQPARSVPRIEVDTKGGPLIQLAAPIIQLAAPNQCRIPPSHVTHVKGVLDPEGTLQSPLPGKHDKFQCKGKNAIGGGGGGGGGGHFRPSLTHWNIQKRPANFN